MKKQALIINTQSFVDVITNSSSEIFICNTDKSLDLINEILQSLLDNYNKSNNSSLTFDSCFGDVSIVGDNKTGSSFIDELPLTKEDALEEKRNEIIISLVSEEIRHNDTSWFKKDWKERNDIIEKQSKALLIKYKRIEKLSTLSGEKSNLPDWWYTGKNNWQYDNIRWRNMYIGRIIIESASDNSIPYELFGEIELTFNAERYHL